MSDEATAAATAAAAAAAAAGTTPAVVAAPATVEATPTAAVSSAATVPVAPAVAAGLMDEEVVVDDATKAANEAKAAADAEAARVAEEGRRAALTDDQRKAEDDAAAAKKAEEDKAKGTDEPVVYTDFTMPEGVKVDAPLLDKAKATFSAQKLTQEQAQAMVDLYAGDVGKMIAEAAAKPYETWRETQAEWTAATIADPEVGGAKLQSSKAAVARAIDTFLNPAEAKEFRAAMSFTGATNNLHAFRFLARVGQRVSEGKFVQGNGPVAAPKSAGAVLFDNPTSQSKPAA